MINLYIFENFEGFFKFLLNVNILLYNFWGRVSWLLFECDGLVEWKVELGSGGVEGGIRNGREI